MSKGSIIFAETISPKNGFPKKIKNLGDVGFSLVELIVAVGIFAIVSVLVGQYASNFFKDKANLQSYIEQSNLASFGARFVNVSETADLGTIFLHLPVPTACSGKNTPCLQTIDGLSGELSPFTGGGLPTNMEFFGDVDASYISSLGNSIAPGANFDARYFINKPIPGSLSKLANQVSVTWPLVDEKSVEFPVLSRSNSSVAFRFISTTASSTAASGSYILTTLEKGSGSQNNLDQILGSPVVVYNPYVPQQFIVMWLSEATSCAANLSACQAQYPNNAITAQHVLVKLNEITSSQFTAFSPQLANYGPLINGTSGAWTYLFPTHQQNLFATNSFNSADLSAPVTIQKWSHFYDSNAMSPHDLFILPVRFSVYLLKVLSKKPGNFTFIRRDFSGKTSPVDITEISSLKGSILFSRKIGTKVLKFTVYGEAE